MNTNLSMKEISKRIKQQLKKEFPSCIFSVRIENYSGGSSLHLNLISGNFDAILFDTEYQNINGIENRVRVECKSQNAQLNEYTLKEYTNGLCNGTILSKTCWTVMKRAVEITRLYNWDNSEPQTDYFDVNFYLYLNIGKWDKPYIKIENNITKTDTKKDIFSQVLKNCKFCLNINTDKCQHNTNMGCFL